MKLIPLYGVNGIGKFAEVDDEDYDFLMKWRWFGIYAKTSSNYYAQCNYNLGNGKWTNRKMHHLIIDKKSGFIIDHKDRNGLNNQKSNLRYCTPSQNAMNKCNHTGSASQYKGVCIRRHKHSKSIKWQSQITINKKRITIGNFPYTKEGEIQAALLYNEYAIKYFGEFANINIIGSKPKKVFIANKIENKNIDKRNELINYIKTIESEYIEKGIRLIPLTKNKIAMIDVEDYDIISKYTWCCSDSSYGLTRIKTKNEKTITLYIHKLVIGAEKGETVDHKDRNPLNCCKSNLRKCSPSENSANTSVRRNKKYTKYFGVFKHQNSWVASICINYKHFRLGRFPFTPEGEILAAKAYNEAAIKYRGEFAHINKLP